MFNRILRTFIIVAGALVCAALPAYPFSIDLTYPDKASLPIMTYATVQGTAEGNTFHFMVDLADGIDSTLQGNSNFGLDAFYFNSDLELIDSMFQNFDPALWNITYDRNANGFGEFSVRLNDPGNRSDHLYFDIVYTSPVTEEDFLLLSSGNAGRGEGHFAVHLGGFNYEGHGGGFIRDGGEGIITQEDDGGGTQAVPEPSTLFLLGGGLLAVYALKKRRSLR